MAAGGEPLISKGICKRSMSRNRGISSMTRTAIMRSHGESVTHHSNQMKLFKSIAASAAVAVITSGGMIGFEPTADAGQIMPKQFSCPSGSSNVGGDYCKVS